MKIGVVGNGMIVGMFLHDAALVEGADIVSLCVRPGSLEKGQKISEEYHKADVDLRNGSHRFDFYNAHTRCIGRLWSYAIFRGVGEP